MLYSRLFDYSIFYGSLTEINFSKWAHLTISTLNPHSYSIAKKDSIFKNALNSSDILLPDGSGIVLAAKLIHNIKIPKIAGSDIHIHLLKEFNVKGGKVFYLGASEETLSKLIERVKKEYPNIDVKSFSPPFKEVFSFLDNEIMISEVNSFAPDVLFVGMTAPKQEKWVYLYKEKLNAKIICSIGAVFDFYAGTKKRSGKIWIKLGLEWLPRLIREPKRMWRRNFISTPVFLWDVFKAMIFKRK